MKKIINILTIGSACVTSAFIICTILTSYQFIYAGQLFYYYMPVQVGVAVTMALLSVRFWINERGMKRIGYSAISLLLSVILLLSMNLVK
ncbi:MAG: hypothetical protein E7213_10235 [Clostridium sp.]|nr:hypothetical protein [Clostridium sp.]